MTPNLEEEIAKRAYAIWEQEGRPKGREMEHWLRAEAELKAPKPTKGKRTRADRAVRQA